MSYQILNIKEILILEEILKLQPSEKILCLIIVTKYHKKRWMTRYNNKIYIQTSNYYNLSSHIIKNNNKISVIKRISMIAKNINMIINILLTIRKDSLLKIKIFKLVIRIIMKNPWNIKVLFLIVY